MPNTYTQLYIHCVFVVKFRKGLIQTQWEENLHKYITGIVQKNGHKLLAINSVSDHVHLLIGYNPVQSLPKLMKHVKGDSSEFINKKGFVVGKFSWQEGYGAFSYSRSQIDTVIKYIAKQKQHHAKQTFREEYLRMLKDYEVDYDERYAFSDLAD